MLVYMLLSRFMDKVFCAKTLHHVGWSDNQIYDAQNKLKNCPSVPSSYSKLPLCTGQSYHLRMSFLYRAPRNREKEITTTL